MTPNWCQVEKVLMTPPDFYRVETSINPFMDPTDPDKQVDPGRAREEWHGLCDAIRGLGVAIELLQPQREAPELVFPADLGLVVHPAVAAKTVVMSRFQSPSRQVEVQFYEEFFRRNGYRVIHVPESISFEINVRETDAVYYLGIGIRNDREGVDVLSPYLDKPVRVLRLVSPWFYHLSCAMAVLDNDTVMYYPEAFDEPSAEMLAKDFARTIVLNRHEALDLTANCTNLNGTILMSESSARVKRTLDSFQIPWIELPVREYQKAGGAVNCLIFLLAKCAWQDHVDRLPT